MVSKAAAETNSSSPDHGGPSAILRLQTANLAELRDAVRSGLPFSAFVELTMQLEIFPRQFTAVLAITPRTVARRKEARHLNPQESDRLYRVARAVSQAVEVLVSMGCEIPLDLLDTEIGARQVDDILLRLNYGNFS